MATIKSLIFKTELSGLTHGMDIVNTINNIFSPNTPTTLDLMPTLDTWLIQNFPPNSFWIDLQMERHGGKCVYQNYSG